MEAGGVKIDENGQSAGNEIKFSYFARILRDYTLYPLFSTGWRYSPIYNWKIIRKLNIDYATVFSLAPFISENIITIIGICLLIGAMAKSSQFGLVKALKKLWCDSGFFWTLIFAGNISNALESVGLVHLTNPVKFQRQGIYQQEINKLADSPKWQFLNQFNHKFLEWFIGFSEGDGSFVVSKGKTVFSIHLHLADLPLLYEIQVQLNMGNIYLNKNSAIFIVKAKKDINTLIEIFNGNIFLRKRQIQFENWVFNFNKKNKFNIEIKSNQFNPSLNDNWLAGFIDAEGSFLVSVCKTKIIQRFVLGQKDAELEFLYLSKLIQGYTEKLKQHDRIVINYLKLDTLIEYLNSHKLYSIKAKSFEKWMEIYNIRKNKSSLEPLDYKQLKKKSSFINALRKISSFIF